MSLPGGLTSCLRVSGPISRYRLSRVQVGRIKNERAFEKGSVYLHEPCSCSSFSAKLMSYQSTRRSNVDILFGGFSHSGHPHPTCIHTRSRVMRLRVQLTWLTDSISLTRSSQFSTRNCAVATSSFHHHFMFSSQIMRKYPSTEKGNLENTWWPFVDYRAIPPSCSSG
jgi:hypothetical protein